MNARKIVLVVGVAFMFAACGTSPEKQKAKAEAEYTKEKTKTMQEYKACVKKAGEDQQKLDACERLIKAAQ